MALRKRRADAEPLRRASASRGRAADLRQPDARLAADRWRVAAPSARTQRAAGAGGCALSQRRVRNDLLGAEHGRSRVGTRGLADAGDRLAARRHSRQLSSARESQHALPAKHADDGTDAVRHDAGVHCAHSRMARSRRAAATSSGGTGDDGGVHDEVRERGRSARESSC